MTGFYERTADRSRAQRIADLAYDYAGRRTEEVTTCNLCGGTRVIEASRRDRYGYPAVLQVCSRCGLGFLSPRLTHEEYGEFYGSVYRPLVSAYHGRLIDAQTVQDEQRDYASSLIPFLVQSIPGHPRSVIDVGGSTGVVAAAVCREFGAEATVLDPSPDELAVAARSGMETVEGLVEAFDPGDRSWDLVLLCQTIDHLLDVRSSLTAIRDMLSPSGHAFVDILDVQFMLRRHGLIEEAVKIDHPYYLTRATARGYLDRVGLDVVAERMSDDGHWGFVLKAGEPREPDWNQLERAAAAFLGDAWSRRATVA